MIIFDTNVVSELMLPNPNPNVSIWAARQELSTIFTTTISKAELRFGVEILPAGRRRDGLLEVVEDILRSQFHIRILPFDSPAAKAYAVIAANRRAAGRPINYSDCQIAAIAWCKDVPVATRDVDGFNNIGIEVINPWAD